MTQSAFKQFFTKHVIIIRRHETPSLFVMGEKFICKKRSKLVSKLAKNIFPKIVPLMRYIEKYGKAEQTTDDNINTAHALCIWNNKGYRHTQKMKNLLLFQCKNCNVKLFQSCVYAHCLSCFDVKPSGKHSKPLGF
jgi:hypothetical protein